MLAVVKSLQSLAASGTATVTISVPNGTRALGIALAAEYAAVAGTSGVKATFQVSGDGTTFVASKVGAVTVNPAAGKIGSGEALFALQDDPYKADGGPIESIKVTLTNLDATNPASVVLLTEDKNKLGR